MLGRGFLGACALAFVMAGSAVAGPLAPNALDGDDNGCFYNRPGTGVAEARADLQYCRMFGNSMTPRSTGAGAAYGLVGALVEVAVAEAMAQGPVRAHTDDCMISLGYRRFSTSDTSIQAFTERFDRMDQATQDAYAGAETPPEGTLAREWTNSYWLAADGDAPASAESRSVRPVMGTATQVQMNRGVEAEDPIAPGPQDAVFVVTLRYASDGRERPSLAFSRDQIDTGMPHMAPIGRNNRMRWPVLEARMDRPARNATGPRAQQFVFVAPAGSYTFSAAASGTATTQFCLGTIAFTAAPGEVLDLGEFVIEPGQHIAIASAPPALFGLRLNAPNIEADRAVLARAPDLAARLQPATFVNGVARGCQVSGAPLYGFDLPGAARHQGYVPRLEQNVPVGEKGAEETPAPVAEETQAPVEAPAEPAPEQ